MYTRWKVAGGWLRDLGLRHGRNASSSSPRNSDRLHSPDSFIGPTSPSPPCGSLPGGDVDSGLGQLSNLPRALIDFLTWLDCSIEKRRVVPGLTRPKRRSRQLRGESHSAHRHQPSTWEVFVTPGIPIVTRDKPPDVRQTKYFQGWRRPLSTRRDARPMDRIHDRHAANNAGRLVAAQAEISTIYITHGHGDHWLLGSRASRAISECQSRRDSEGREV